MLSGMRGRANTEEVDLSAAENSASELVAGEAWKNEADNATVVYVGEKASVEDASLVSFSARVTTFFSRKRVACLCEQFASSGYTATPT